MTTTTLKPPSHMAPHVCVLAVVAAEQAETSSMCAQNV